jgi:hypothetical protein
MVHGIASLRTLSHAGATSAAASAARPKQTVADAAPSSTTSSFAALLTAAGSPGDPPAAAPSNPTAESVFGPNPFVANPQGIGPGGVPYSYNPMYFATPQTAAKVAQMLGGTVVESNMFTPNGGPFSQSQPCQMVRLADGRLINAGVIATHYTHNYPQSYIDQLVAAELRTT